MNNTLSARPIHTVFINSLLFAPPFFILISNHGTGLYSLIFVLTALLCWPAARAALRPHLGRVGGVLLAFAFCLAVALAEYLFNPEVRLRDLEKPVRMMAAACAMLTVLALRPPRRFFWWGLIAGSVAGAGFIVYQRWGLGLDRPGGLINSITFGDISLVMGLMCLAGSLDFKRWGALWPALGVLAGLVGSIATGTRGGLIAIVFAVVVLLKYGQLLRGRFRKGMALLALALLVSTYFIPQTGARARIEQGVDDVRAYLAGGNTFTNVGVRLELWRGGAHLVAQHPWRGSSVPEVRREMAAMVARGELPAFVLEFAHFHNDALQATVSGGVAGLLAWAGTLLLPLRFFLRQLDAGRGGRRDAVAPALAGLLLVVSYFGFGLTEMIFWSGHSAVFYAVTLFLLVGLCLTARADAAPAAAAAGEAA